MIENPMSSLMKVYLLIVAVLSATSALTNCGGMAWGQIVPINAAYEVRVSDYYGQLRQDGYVPLRFTINRMGQVASQAETLYAGVLTRSYARRGESAREVSVRVDFEPGQTTATVDVNVPFYQYYSGQHAVVSRDGSMATFERRDLIASVRLPDWLGVQPWNAGPEVEGLSIGLFSSNPTFDSGWHFYSYKMTDGKFFNGSILQPEVKALPNVPVPKFAALIDILKNQAQRKSQIGTLSTPANLDYRAAMDHRFLVSGDLTAIPETWMGLIRLDIAMLSVADLQVLANRHPSRLEALRLWVASGGRLIVFDCGSDFRGLPSIVPNLSVSAPRRPLPNQPWWIPDSDCMDNLQKGYLRTADRYADDLDSKNQTAAFRYNSEMLANPIRGWMLEQNFLKDARRVVGPGAAVAQQIAAEQAELAITPYGTGRIVATAGQVTQFAQLDWVKVLMAACGSEQPFTYDGIGSYNHDWKGYPDFEVANVGKPPWVAFLILITTFALLVGPVAFAILKRTGRTHLLLAVVPIFAAMVTAGITCYSIIQDGMGFRTARLSVTWLDSQHQTALVQTNQAIYAGLAPGRLVFSPQTIYFDNSSQLDYGTGRLRIYSADDTQTVSGGRILARTKHQVINFNISATESRVVVEAAGSEGSWTVTNQLGFDARLLVVRTDDGVWCASNVADGANAELTRDLSDLDSWRSQTRAAGRDGHAVSKLILDNASSFATREAGRISKVFSAVTADPSQRLRPGEFIAVSSQQPLAQSLHPRAQQDEELHLTIGAYISGRSRLPATSADDAQVESE